MKLENVDVVMALARDLLKLAGDAAIAAHDQQAAMNQRLMDSGYDPVNEYPDVSHTVESAALRRRSMDLTRALAKMRNEQ